MPMNQVLAPDDKTKRELDKYRASATVHAVGEVLRGWVG